MQRRSARERQRYRQAHWAHGPRWQRYALGGERWFGFESVRAVGGTDDEILIVPLLGHTRGHAGIAVKTERGWLLHAGDAYFAHEEVHGRRWRCPPGLALFQTIRETDGHTRIANQRRLRELIRDQHAEVQVLCAHDTTELDAALRA